MQSVGEAMAIGRTFQESLQKAIRSLELDFCGLDLPKIHASENPDSGASLATPEIKPDLSSNSKKNTQKNSSSFIPDHWLKEKLEQPNSQRIWYLAEAIRRGWSNADLHHITQIDPWSVSYTHLTLPTIYSV